MGRLRSAVCGPCFILWLGIAGHAQSAIPLETAKQYFDEAKAICTADKGQLWEVSLCGPLLFVDADTRAVVANQADKSGLLKAQDEVFIGTLPKEENMANTATDWAGVKWTEMVWPLPQDSGRRHILMAHEMYHRVQGQITKTMGKQPSNAHLDELEGRYLLQLEWNALAEALRENNAEERDRAVRDALLFRSARYKLYPSAELEEGSLEMNEGLAEYTGVMLGNTSGADRTKAAVRDITVHKDDQTYVRSFAYATGPAYGLLLDQLRGGWKHEIRSGTSPFVLLREAVNFRVPFKLEEAVEKRSQVYKGSAIRAAEVERDRKRQAVIAKYRATFVEGPTLMLPFRHMQVQFDPRNLQPLPEVGTVYPTIRITDDWGVLEAKNGALLKPDWSAIVIAAPSEVAGTPVTGDGWRLDLKPGWKLVTGTRKGDYTVAAPN